LLAVVLVEVEDSLLSRLSLAEQRNECTEQCPFEYYTATRTNESYRTEPNRSLVLLALCRRHSLTPRLDPRSLSKDSIHGRLLLVIRISSSSLFLRPSAESGERGRTHRLLISLHPRLLHLLHKSPILLTTSQQRLLPPTILLQSSILKRSGSADGKDCSADGSGAGRQSGQLHLEQDEENREEEGGGRTGRYV
jgi:hypothetical protein